MNWTRLICVLAAVFALVGYAADQPDPHVLKHDQTYDCIIVTPHEWALQQLSDGPISGTNVSDYARSVLADGLSEGQGDIGGDGSKELFLRSGCPARMWEVLVFTPVTGGYRYLGHFPAGAIVLNAGQATIQVYQPCGGHYGYIKTYQHDGKRFVCISVQGIDVGDGAPDENNRKMARLFSDEKVLKWAKVPKATFHGTALPRRP
jgi:hypothetical protein